MAKGETFHIWEHSASTKGKGGRVYVANGHGGDVTFHEGYVIAKEARRLERGDGLEKLCGPRFSAPSMPVSTCTAMAPCA